MDEDIDITADLTDGSDGALGDALPSHGTPPNAAGEGTQSAAPDGTVPANAQPEKKEQEFSLRDSLSSAFKEGDEAPQQPTQEAPAKPELTQDGEGRYRRKDGTFANADEIAAFTAAPEGVQQGEPQFASVLAGMTPQEQEQFKALPAEIQQHVGRTMEAVHAQRARYSEYDQLEQHLFGPRRQAWAQQGMNSVTALNQLFSLSDFAGRDPTQFVLWFADQHKIDLDAALDARDQQNANVDPAVRELRGQVQQLQQQLSHQTGTQQRATETEAQTAVRTFSEEKDGAGKPKRPYLPEVMDSWAQHVHAVRNANPAMPNTDVLQKAYEAACWSNPAVRAKMQKEEQEARRAEQQQRAQRARLAGSSVNGSPLGSTPAQQQPSGNLSLRDELAAQFRQQSA